MLLQYSCCCSTAAVLQLRVLLQYYSCEEAVAVEVGSKDGGWHCLRAGQYVWLVGCAFRRCVVIS